MKSEDVLKIAKLANISLTDAEADSYKENLHSMVEFIKGVSLWDETEGDFGVSFETHLREDEIEKSLPRDEILRNAPKCSEGFFAVSEKG